MHVRHHMFKLGICGLVGRATTVTVTFVGGDAGVGSIPTCGALEPEVWQPEWTFGSRTVWLVNRSAGQPQFYDVVHA